MPIINPMQMVLNQLANNPNIVNDPQKKHMLEVLQTGNAEEGKKIAQELCQTYGVSMEEAVQKSKSFFQSQGR